MEFLNFYGGRPTKALGYWLPVSVWKKMFALKVRGEVFLCDKLHDSFPQ